MSTVIEIEKAIERLPQEQLNELREWFDEYTAATTPNEENLSPEWRAELDARVQRRQNGDTRSYSREEVHAKMEALLASCD